MPLYNPNISPTFTYPVRTIGTSFQISTTQMALVSYSVSTTISLSLLNLNSSAVVYLELSTDNITWIPVNNTGTTKALSVAITLGLNETSYYNLQASVPANFYVRLRSVLSGGGNANYISGQEVTL